jgi:uncharacterized damage-inducible protein DinB
MRNHSIIVALIDVLEQERSLLSKLDPACYTAPGTGAFRSSIGAHIRHNLDHFTSFFAGLADGRIDYEKRRRDDGIARSTEHALADIEKHISVLETLIQEEPDDFLRVRDESDLAAEGELRWLDSSVGRELQFLVGHTVHHHAIIALLLAQQGVDLPEGFGIAPSTLRHERKAMPARGRSSI